MSGLPPQRRRPRLLQDNDRESIARERTLRAILDNSTILRNNNNILKDINNPLLRIANVTGNFLSSFKRADDLQIKSLAIGSNLNKFLSANTKTLEGLRGDFFANAEDLLQNFNLGLRENSDDLNDLSTRMRLTGQSTEILRATLIPLQVAIGGNVDAIGRLSKSNIELSKTYGVTSEVILQALNSVKELIDTASVAGVGEQIADLTQSLTAAVGPKAQTQITKTLNLLASPNFLSTRFALGIGDATDKILDSSLSTNERLDATFQVLEKIKTSTDSVIGNSKTSNDLAMKTFRLQGLGNSDELIASRQLFDAFKDQRSKNNEIKSSTDDVANSLKNTEAEALNFYRKATGEVFPFILEKLPLLFSVAAAGTDIVKGLVSGLKESRANGGGLAGLLGVAGGPLVKLITLGVTLGPSMYDYFTGAKARELEKLKAAKISAEKLTKLEERGKEIQKPGGSVESFLLRNVMNAINSSGSRTKVDQDMKENNRLLQQLLSAIQKSGSKPADSKGGF